MNEGPVRPCIQKEDEGKEALQYLGIDVCLIGGRASVTNATPVSDREMTVPVFHAFAILPSTPSLIEPEAARRGRSSESRANGPGGSVKRRNPNNANGLAGTFPAPIPVSSRARVADVRKGESGKGQGSARDPR